MHRNKVDDSGPREQSDRRRFLLRRQLAWGLGAACLLAIAGCGWTPRDSKQGKELENILLQRRAIKIAVTDDLPIRFDPPEVERQTDATTVSYRAAVIWHRSDSLERLQQRARQLATKRKRNVGDATVTHLAFLLTYQDQQGQPCGSETVWIGVQEEAGKVLLPQMGKEGSPFKATAQPVRLRTVVKRRIAMDSKVKMFVELEQGEREQYREISLNTPDERDTQDVSHLSWKLAGSPDEVRARLRKQVLAKRPELRDFEAKAISLSLEYHDPQGRLCGAEKIDINLDSEKGAWLLKQVPLEQPAITVSASLSTVTVRGRDRIVSFE